MKKLELKFSYERPTKNTVRYKEEAHSSRDIACGSLYVRKAVLGEPVPQRLKLTIEEDTKGK